MYEQAHVQITVLCSWRCEECGKLQAALELGTAHGVEGWEIVVSHVRVLLISNSALIAQRLSDNRLIQLLRDNSSDVVMRYAIIKLRIIKLVHK